MNILKLTPQGRIYSNRQNSIIRKRKKSELKYIIAISNLSNIN